ncbi:MAG TPA: hypothetical protein VNC41_16735, partial [Acidimicrobiia bacterium]|nr:hypothetical protein [Acidimicrobiia bacterium]
FDKPEPAQLVEDLDRLTADGTAVTMVFAPDEPGEHYARTVGGAGLERLLARPHLDIVQVPGGDHVFNPPGSRARLIDLLTSLLHETDTASSSIERSSEHAG